MPERKQDKIDRDCATEGEKGLYRRHEVHLVDFLHHSHPARRPPALCSTASTTMLKTIENLFISVSLAGYFRGCRQGRAKGSLAPRKGEEWRSRPRKRYIPPLA
jgi:hypothetical protein